MTVNINRKHKIVMTYLDVILVVIGLNIVFSYGFSNFGLRLGSIIVPVNQIILAIGLVRMMVKRSFHIKKTHAFLFFLSIISILRMVISVTEYGAFALRDGTHYIDMLFLCVVDSEMRRNRGNKLYGERLWNVIDIICWISFSYYILMKIPTTAGILSIISPSYAGMQASFKLFSSTAYAMLWHSMFAITHAARMHSGQLTSKKRLLYSLHIYVIIIIQFSEIGEPGGRSTLISLLMASLVLVLLGKRSIITIFNRKIVIVCAFGWLLLLTGIGLFNSSLTIDHFINVIRSIWGAGTYSRKAGGTALRFSWWVEIIKESCSNATKFLFGQGFGQPLTNFVASTSLQVREPHNSFISVFARTGFIGLIIFLGGGSLLRSHTAKSHLQERIA